MEKIELFQIKTEAYQPYGDLLSAAGAGVFANEGNADKFVDQAELCNLRENAQPKLSVFRCAPKTENPLPIKFLERHEHSTQVFIPMGGAKRFLAVVALGGDAPDLSTLKAFWVGPAQGISYRPGVWHAPMTVLDVPTDMACFVYEDGTAADCEMFELKTPLFLDIPEGP
ncbi:MAG: ureidoglycolate hydrolase [Elusimicrobia bacterium]|nr:MAG: ureidoglycolate hydrolase [Elusimicrobiota bacterium]